MAVTLRQPRQQVVAASATALVLAGLLAAPVLAAPERGLLCDDTTPPSLDVSPHALTATPVSNSDELLESHLLRPRAKAAARGAFPDGASGDDGKIDTVESEVKEAVVPGPGIRSTAEQKRAVYKRPMYRRDI